MGSLLNRVMAAGCVVVAAALLNASSAWAAFPGSNGWIVFDRVDAVSERVEIQRINPDGTLPLRLTEDGSDPAFSPDTKKLALTRGGDIYKLNANGRRLIRLTSTDASDSQPAWSANGEKIAFVRRRGGDPEIYTMKANGKKLRRLTKNSIADRYPAWSPDGKRIAFSRGGTDLDIRTMKPNGKNVKRLTTGKSRSDAHPNWSPDGRMIVFAATAKGAPSRLYTMRANGKKQRSVTAAGLVGTAPAFSPDGTQIVFAGAFPSLLGIHTIDTDGTDQRRLTTSGANPDWQPR